MKKLLSVLVGAALAPAVAFSSMPVSATTEPGQIEGGDIYWAKNVTKGGSFVDPASATCGDTVQFRVRAHNPGPSPLTNVNVKATLPTGTATSHSSTVTLTSASAHPSTTTDTAGVKLDKAGKLAYVAGSTELLDANGSKMSTFGDTIFTSGVNIETIGVSTQQKRFVQFSVKVECDVPEVKNIQVCELSTKKVITIKENEFDAAKHSKNLDDCKEVVKHIKVCELATKKIVTIKESDFNSSKHSRDLAKCVEKPTPGEITVCELASKKVMNIKENEFDAAKHTRDLNKCAEVLATSTPTVIASTGPASTIATMTGLSALAAGIGYFVQRRRNMLG